MAVRYDVYLEQASDYSFGVTWKSGGVIVPLTGWDARLVAKEYPSAAVEEIVLTVGDGLSIDGVNGKVGVTIPGVSTLGVEWKELEYDLIVWLGPASAPTAMKKLTEGNIYLDATVTEPA